MARNGKMIKSELPPPPTPADLAAMRKRIDMMEAMMKRERMRMPTPTPPVPKIKPITERIEVGLKTRRRMANTLMK